MNQSPSSAARRERPRRVAVLAGGLCLAVSLSLGIGGARDVSAAAHNVITVAGSGAVGSTDATGRYASFRYPLAIVADGRGNAYVADTGNNVIRRVVLSSGAVTTVAGDGAVGSDDGPAATASFNFPSGLALVNPATLAIADAYSHKIRVLNIPTGAVSTLAGSGTFGMADGVGTNAQFGTPYDVVFDGAGALYVADGGVDVTSNLETNSIRKVDLSTGAVTTVAGTGAFGITNGPTAIAEFRQPYGLAVSGNHLYVADSLNNSIRRIDLAARTIADLAGTGVAGFKDGPVEDAQFDSPRRVIVHGSRLLVADTNNHRIRVIDLAENSVSTLNQVGMGGLNTGSSAPAPFSSPVGLAVDVSGYLLVADTLNHSVRAIDMGSPIRAPIADATNRTVVFGGGRPTVTSAPMPTTATTLGPLVMMPTLPGPSGVPVGSSAGSLGCCS